jgi:hypothetical protein
MSTFGETVLRLSFGSILFGSPGLGDWATMNYGRSKRSSRNINSVLERLGMSTLVTECDVFGVSVHFSEDAMTVQLDDGRSLSVPLAWYPRLLHGTPAEREIYELIGDGEGIHWPKLDEDISVEGLLAGRRSTESAASLAKWKQRR